MKTIVTAWDIENARSAGRDKISVQDAIVTEAAKDLAEKHGIKIIVDNAQLYDTTTSSINPLSAARSGFLKITDADAEQWKDEFPILKNAIHVANCSQGPQAKRVRKAINVYLDNWLTVGMDWDYWVEETIKAKHEFAKLINADPDEIAISTSVSEATSSVASALNPYAGRKKIVTTEADFPTIGHVWLGHQKYGYKVDFVPVKNGEIDISDYEKYIDENTVITSITHVYYETGFRQDIEKIADIAHKNGSLFYVDAYQSLGSIKIDVKKMKIDMLASGNLKYLLGVPGIAFLYISKDKLPYLKPAVTGWFGQENPFAFQIRHLDYAGDGRRFDTGTPPVLAAFASKAGMEIINEVGTQNIQDRIEMLSDHTVQVALEKGFDVKSPRDPKRKGATTSIKVDNPNEVEQLLKQRKIIASARGEVIRIAPHFFTTRNDIDMVLEELKKLVQR